MAKIKQHFVSELDTFLQTFDAEHPDRSLSQQKEIDKHRRIAALRDDPNAEAQTTKLWGES